MVPRLPNYEKLATQVLAAVNDRDRALTADREARALVEATIEEAA